jgi:tetratricopeptide (TPR) repeat protein
MRTTILAVGLWAGACGSPPPPARPVTRSAEIDVPALLLEVGAERTPALRRPAEPVDALKDAVRAGRGAERFEALRKLALAELWAGEEATDERDAKRARKAAIHTTHDARGRTRNQAVLAELAFVELWCAWRAGRDGAEDLAARYAEDRHEAGELMLFARAIAGELALEREDYPQAAEAYRWLLVQLEHPLYAYALWRTAACYRGMGRDDDAKQALREAADAGSGPNAADAAKRIAAVARAELGEPEPTKN